MVRVSGIQSRDEGRQLRRRLQEASRFIAFVGLLVLLSVLNAQECKECSKGKVDIPISLAIGTVRTPPIRTKHKFYQISIQFQGPSALYGELRCKVGALSFDGIVSDRCRAQLLIEAKWRVLDGNRVVAQGPVEGFSSEFDFGPRSIRRYIGEFECEMHHECVVEVTFTKDGSSLNAANPRLIVSPPEAAF